MGREEIEGTEDEKCTKVCMSTFRGIKLFKGNILSTTKRFSLNRSAIVDEEKVGPEISS